MIVIELWTLYNENTTNIFYFHKTKVIQHNLQ